MPTPAEEWLLQQTIPAEQQGSSFMQPANSQQPISQQDVANFNFIAGLTEPVDTFQEPQTAEEEDGWLTAIAKAGLSGAVSRGQKIYSGAATLATDDAAAIVDWTARKSIDWNPFLDEEARQQAHDLRERMLTSGREWVTGTKSARLLDQYLTPNVKSKQGILGLPSAKRTVTSIIEEAPSLVMRILLSSVGGGPSTFAALSAAEQGALNRFDSAQRNVDPLTANAEAFVVGAVNGAMDSIPGMQYLGKTPAAAPFAESIKRRLAKYLTSGVTEGVTEAAQGAWEDSAKYWFENDPEGYGSFVEMLAQTGDKRVEEFWIGAILGAGVDATVDTGMRRVEEGRRKARTEFFKEKRAELGKTRDDFVKNILTPEGARQYAEVLPEEAGLLAQIESPSRKEWKDLNPTPYMPSAEQRKEFAGLVKHELENTPEKRYQRWSEERQKLIDLGLTEERASELARKSTPLSQAEERKFSGWVPPSTPVGEEAPMGFETGKMHGPARAIPAEMEQYTFELPVGDSPDPRTSSEKARQAYWERAIQENTQRYVDMGLTDTVAADLAKQQADEARYRWLTGDYEQSQAQQAPESRQEPLEAPVTAQTPPQATQRPQTPTSRQTAPQSPVSVVATHIDIDTLSNDQIAQIANEAAADTRPYAEVFKEAKDLGLLKKGMRRSAEALRARIAEEKARKKPAQTQPVQQQVEQQAAPAVPPRDLSGIPTKPQLGAMNPDTVTKHWAAATGKDSKFAPGKTKMIEEIEAARQRQVENVQETLPPDQHIPEPTRPSDQAMGIVGASLNGPLPNVVKQLKRAYKYLAYKSGVADKRVYEAELERDRYIQGAAYRISKARSEYERARDDVVGKTSSGLPAIQDKDITAVNEAAQNPKWERDPLVARAEAIAKLQAARPHATRQQIERWVDSIAKMRTVVDETTKKLVSLGALTPDMQLTVDKNLGVYLTRTYNYWDDPEHASKLRETRPDVWSNLVNWFKAYLDVPIDIDTLPQRQRYAQTTGLGTFPTRQAASAAAIGAGLRGHRIRKVGTDWVILTPQHPLTVSQIARRHGIATRGRKKADVIKDIRDKAAAYTPQDFRNFADEFITNPAFDKQAAAGGKVRQSPAGILKQRKEILNRTEVLRKALGEYQDFAINAVRSVEKMSALIGDAIFVNSLVSMNAGPDKMFYAPGESRPKGYNHPVQNSSKVWKPLNGYYTTRDNFRALNKAQTQMNGALKLWLKATASVRAGKTIWNLPMSHVRNFTSMSLVSLANGHVPLTPGRWKAWASAVNAAYEIAEKDLSPAAMKAIKFYPLSPMPYAKAIEMLSSGVATGDAAKRLAEEAMDMGVPDTSGTRADIQALIAENQITSPWDLSEKGWKRKAARAQRGAGATWTFGDNVWKIYGYLLYQQELQKAYGTTKSPAEIQKMAAERTINTYPTGANAPNLIRALRVAPIGNFPTFAWEILRTTARAATYNAQDYMEGRRTNNKTLRMQALNRQLGQVLAITAVPTIAATLLKAAFGVSDEEDEANKRFWMPEWTAGRLYLPSSYDDNGVKQYNYIDLSYSAPYEYIREPIMRLAESLEADNLTWEEKIKRGVWEGLKQFADPFTDPDLVGSVLIDVARGTTAKGGTVRDKTMAAEVQVSQALDYVLEKWSPGFLHRVRRITEGYQNKRNKGGEEIKLWGELGATIAGVRIQTVDIEPLLRNSMKRYSANIRDNTAHLGREVKSLGTIDLERVKQSYNEMEDGRYRLWRDMFTELQAAKKAGMQDNQILDLVAAEKLIGEDEIKNLLLGIYQPYVPSRVSMVQISNRPDGEERLRLLNEAIDERLTQSYAGELDLAVEPE